METDLRGTERLPESGGTGGRAGTSPVPWHWRDLAPGALTDKHVRRARSRLRPAT